MSTQQELEGYLIEVFQWFHRHPELSYEEYRTTERIRELLEREGIETQTRGLQTGLIAVVRGSVPAGAGKKAPAAALRCDIDALPIEEQAKVEYPSEHPGRMHACGHDFHITAGIGTAVLLQRQREQFCGTVHFLFQPGEEESHGALQMLKTGVLEETEHIWGFHADPTNEVNVVGIREGYVTAAVDRFVIRIRGIGCHGAHPEDGVDPILTAAAMVQGLQSIVSRNANPFHPSLLSVTRIEAGNTWNVIPAEAYLEGTVRTMYREDRLLFEKRAAEMAERIAAAYGAEAELEWTEGPPAVANDKKLAGLCTEVAHRLGMETVPEESSMGGDDFSFYLEKQQSGRKVPGCYVKLGCGVGHPIHHPAFRVDPRAIYPAARFLAELLREDLKGLGKSWAGIGLQEHEMRSNL